MGLSTYFSETKKELVHVTWPTQRAVMLYTGAVIIISIISAYMLGAFDAILKAGLTYLLAL